MDFLTSGERVQKKISPSRRSPMVIKYYILGILLLIFGMLLLFGVFPTPELVVFNVDIIFNVAMTMVFLMPILFIYGEVKRRHIGTYIITNFRIIVKRGILRTKIDSVTNKMIVNVRAMQTFWERVLGIGNVDITTSRGAKEIELKDITHYKEVENLIYKMIESRGFNSQEPNQRQPQRYKQ